MVDALQRGFFALLPHDIDYRSTGFIPRQDLVRSSYIDKFPQFVARITPELDEDDGGNLVTLPSACLSLYPMIAARGELPGDGLLTTVSAPCFRNEAGYGPERMRAFSMAEYVFFGEASQTDAFREDMIGRVQAWLQALELSGRLANASDPFFGRMGEILAERQRSANLKQELLLPIAEGSEIAGFSFNDHKDFFCSRWDIRGANGDIAQSACVGVGLERLALAMLHRHGSTLDAWPAAFKSLL
jgi:seryl-tRNA synthetase